MNILERLYFRAQSQLRHIVLPEGGDERTLRAAEMIVARKLARITVIGRPDTLRLRCEGLGVSTAGFEIVDHLSHPELDACRQEYFKSRRHKGVTEAEAEKALGDPLYFANILVRRGLADGTVAGLLAGRQTKRMIVVAGRLVNVVV